MSNQPKLKLSDLKPEQLQLLLEFQYPYLAAHKEQWITRRDTWCGLLITAFLLSASLIISLPLVLVGGFPPASLIIMTFVDHADVIIGDAGDCMYDTEEFIADGNEEFKNYLWQHRRRKIRRERRISPNYSQVGLTSQVIAKILVSIYRMLPNRWRVQVGLRGLFLVTQGFSLLTLIVLQGLNILKLDGRVYILLVIMHVVIIIASWIKLHHPRKEA